MLLVLMIIKVVIVVVMIISCFYYQDPQGWDDVLQSGRIKGACQKSGCHGKTAVCKTDIN